MKNLEAYEKVYKLITASHRENVSLEFFKSCSNNCNFVVICIFNKKGEVFLFRDFGKNIGWELPGGYVYEGEKIEDAVNRIVLRETGLAVNELEPIFLLKNVFCYKDKCKNHKGVVFLAITSGDIRNGHEYIQKAFTKELPVKMAYQNKKIVENARIIFENKIYDLPYEEIESVKKHFKAHIFHKLLIQRIGNLASVKIKKELLLLIAGYPETILDASCGDDGLIFELEKRFRSASCFANDISWKAISILRNRHPKSNVIFTNHNALNFPFKGRFDLILFKNSMHHILYENQAEMINILSSKSKQLIICDIDNPQESSFLAKLWNWYYVHVLDDCGDSFINYEQFQELIRKGVPKDKDFRFGKIRTIKGEYMYADIADVEIRKPLDLKQI